MVFNPYQSPPCSLEPSPCSFCVCFDSCSHSLESCKRFSLLLWKSGNLAKREVTSVSTASSGGWLLSWWDPSNCFSEGTGLCEGLFYLPCKALKRIKAQMLALCAGGTCLKQPRLWGGFCEDPSVIFYFKQLLPLFWKRWFESYDRIPSHVWAENKYLERLIFLVLPSLPWASSWWKFLTLLWHNT